MVDGQTPVPFKEQSVSTLKKKLPRKKSKLFRACAVLIAATIIAPHFSYE